MIEELKLETIYESLRKKLNIVISENDCFNLSFNREIGMLETLLHKLIITNEQFINLKSKLQELEQDFKNIELAKEILNKIN